MSETNLETAFAEELVTRAEGNLDDGAELRHFLRGVVLDIRDTLYHKKSQVHQRPLLTVYCTQRETHLEVRDELFHNDFPRNKPLNQYV